MYLLVLPGSPQREHTTKFPLRTQGISFFLLFTRGFLKPKIPLETRLTLKPENTSDLETREYLQKPENTSRNQRIPLETIEYLQTSENTSRSKRIPLDIREYLQTSENTSRSQRIPLESREYLQKPKKKYLQK